MEKQSASAEQSPPTLESLRHSLEEARGVFADAYWQELIYQHGGDDSGKSTRAVRRGIARTRRKAEKKGAAEGPLNLVDESRARQGYRDAKHGYDEALSAYLTFVGTQGDAQSVLDAELAEQTKLASQIETKVFRRGFRKTMEGMKVSALYVARGIAAARKWKAVEWLEKNIKENKTIAAIAALFTVAGLAYLFPFIVPFILGAGVGLIVRYGVKGLVKKYYEYATGLGTLKEVDAELNQSWDAAKKNGVPYAEWRKQNAKLINHRAKVARNAQIAGTAVGIGAGVTVFLLTGHGIGWNLAHHGAGYSAADLSLVPSAMAAEPAGHSPVQQVGYRPGGEPPPHEPVAPGRVLGPDFEITGRISSMYEYFQAQFERITGHEETFLLEIDYLKHLNVDGTHLSPQDIALLDRIHSAYLAAKNAYTNDLNELQGQRLKDYMRLAADTTRPAGERAAYRSVVNEILDEINGKVKQDLATMDALMRAVDNLQDQAERDPSGFVRRGLSLYREASIARDSGFMLASAEAPQGNGSSSLIADRGAGSHGARGGYNPDLGRTPVTPENAEILKQIGNMSVSDIKDLDGYWKFLDEQQPKALMTLANLDMRLGALQKAAELNPDISTTDIAVLKRAIQASTAEITEEVARSKSSIITGPMTEIGADGLRQKAHEAMQRIWNATIVIHREVEQLEKVVGRGMPNVRPAPAGPLST